MMKTRLLTIIAAFVTLMTISAEMNAADKKTPSFPGAQGYGMYVTGGRGGAVYHVTTLEDNSKAGSLRYAINQKGARTIVFDVSGTIHLTSELDISNGDVTIAGQSAPGAGICIADWPVVIKGSNVIIRYIRFRLGNTYVSRTDGDGGHQGDGLGGMDGSNIIVDHCSVSWSIDECLSVYGNRNTTVQWCMAYESLRNAGHYKGAHGYGGMMGGGRTTYHHNLIAHHDSRTPRFAFRSANPTSEEHPTDYRNNVIYNYGKNGCYGAEEMNINIVNNYYKPGPFTKKQREGYQKRICGPGQGTHYDADGNVSEYVWGHYYVDGNVNTDWDDVTKDNWTVGLLNQIKSDIKTSKYAWGDITADTIHKTEPMPYALVTTHTAEKAYEKVLAYAGASLHRDALDAIIADDARNTTATFTGASESDRPGIIDVPEEAKTDGDDAWPMLVSEEALTDTDGDGIPDNWEVANGLNPNDAADGAAVTDDGYTNLEHYLNSLVEDITTAQMEDGEITGDDVATTGALISSKIDATNAIDIPTTEDFDLTKATTSGGTIKVVDGINTIDNVRASQTWTFVINVTKEQKYILNFKACTKQSDVSLNFTVTDGANEEMNKDVKINNNGSWTSFQDYSVETDVLSEGVKYLIITFNGSKYTANVECITMTAAEEAGISEILSDDINAAMPVYNLSGQRVSAGNAKGGVYIINKKKVFIR